MAKKRKGGEGRNRPGTAQPAFMLFAVADSKKTCSLLTGRPCRPLMPSSPSRLRCALYVSPLSPTSRTSSLFHSLMMRAPQSTSASGHQPPCPSCALSPFTLLSLVSVIRPIGTPCHVLASCLIAVVCACLRSQREDGLAERERLLRAKEEHLEESERSLLALKDEVGRAGV